MAITLSAIPQKSNLLLAQLLCDFVGVVKVRRQLNSVQYEELECTIDLANIMTSNAEEGIFRSGRPQVDGQGDRVCLLKHQF